MSRVRIAGTRALAGLALAATLGATGPVDAGAASAGDVVPADAGAASSADVVPADPAIGGTLYLANGNDGTDYPVGATVGWNDPVIALPAPRDQKNRLVAPPGTESVVTFVGPQGRESDPTSWNATAPWELTRPGQWMADVTPYHLVTPGSGSPSGTNATATVSGDYSLGVAYLDGGGLHVVPGGLYFVHIHLTGSSVSDKATYTWRTIQATGPAPAASSPAPSGTSASSAAGLLSFVAPAGPGASGPPGTLTVDGGAASAPSWTLTVSTGGDARTVATGSGGPTPVDVPPMAPAAPGPTTITLTVVSG